MCLTFIIINNPNPTSLFCTQGLVVAILDATTSCCSCKVTQERVIITSKADHCNLHNVKLKDILMHNSEGDFGSSRLDLMRNHPI